MTAQYPVHPDDVEQLLKIRRYLIGFRITNGWTQQDLSRKIGGVKGNGWVYDLESSHTWGWRFSRLQEWTVPFGLRLAAQLKLSTELSRLVHADPEVAPAYALSCQPQGWQSWQRVYLTLALRAARYGMRMSSERMGARMGITGKAVRRWESSADEVLLPKVLFYARALGGHVALSLDNGQ